MSHIKGFRILVLIYPRGKGTIFNDFAGSVERTAIPPPAEDVQIILYDEQHPKAGRTQKFRLTLLDDSRDEEIELLRI